MELIPNCNESVIAKVTSKENSVTTCFFVKMDSMCCMNIDCCITDTSAVSLSDSDSVSGTGVGTSGTY